MVSKVHEPLSSGSCWSEKFLLVRTSSRTFLLSAKTFVIVFFNFYFAFYLLITDSQNFQRKSTAKGRWLRKSWSVPLERSILWWGRLDNLTLPTLNCLSSMRWATFATYFSFFRIIDKRFYIFCAWFKLPQDVDVSIRLSISRLTRC